MHVVEQAALGPVPARRRPGGFAPVGPEHRVAGLPVDVAGGPDDGDDHGLAPWVRRLVVAFEDQGPKALWSPGHEESRPRALLGRLDGVVGQGRVVSRRGPPRAPQPLPWAWRTPAQDRRPERRRSRSAGCRKDRPGGPPDPPRQIALAVRSGRRSAGRQARRACTPRRFHSATRQERTSRSSRAVLRSSGPTRAGPWRNTPSPSRTRTCGAA